MVNKVINHSSNSILHLINEQVNDDSIEEITYKINKKKGIINITGKKSDEVFSATKTLFDDCGIIQVASEFKANMSKSDRIEHVKKMRKKGFKQQEIANMIGISQAQVSNILHRRSL